MQNSCVLDLLYCLSHSACVKLDISRSSLRCIHQHFTSLNKTNHRTIADVVPYTYTLYNRIHVIRLTQDNPEISISPNHFIVSLTNTSLYIYLDMSIWKHHIDHCMD